MVASANAPAAVSAGADTLPQWHLTLGDRRQQLTDSGRDSSGCTVPNGNPRWNRRKQRILGGICLAVFIALGLNAWQDDNPRRPARRIIVMIACAGMTIPSAFMMVAGWNHLDPRRRYDHS